MKTFQKDQTLFSSAFKNSPIGMALVSSEGKFIKTNRSLCALFEYTEDELLNTSFQELTHPDDLEKDLDLMRQTLAGERDSYQMEKRYFNKSGDILWTILAVSLIRNEDNSPDHFISQIQDVTELKRSQEELISKQKMEDFWKLSIRLAHEVHNPLTAMKLWSDALYADRFNLEPEFVIRVTENISTSVTRISNIINELRELSNPENFNQTEIKQSLNSLNKFFEKSY
jgi:two-component system, cell cycle sensor histidine kinase and response regulator CckA